MSTTVHRLRPLRGWWGLHVRLVVLGGLFLALGMAGRPHLAFSGRILDRQGRPVAHARIEVNGAEGRSAENGFFQVLVRPADLYVLNITHRDFADFSYIADGPLRGITWRLVRAQIEMVSSTRAIRLEDRRRELKRGDRRGALFELPPNALEDARGHLPTGPVRAAIATLDIENGEAPGDWAARMDDGRDGYLASYGAVFIQFMDWSGRVKYQLRKGMSGRLTVPVSPSARAHYEDAEGARFWYYDLKDGYWKPAGKGSFDRRLQAFSGIIRHLSVLNTDIVRANAACLKLTLDPSVPLNSKIRVSYSSGGTFFAQRPTLIMRDTVNGIRRLPAQTRVLLELLDSNGQPLPNFVVEDPAGAPTADNVVDTGPPIPPGQSICPGPPFAPCRPLLLRLQNAPPAPAMATPAADRTVECDGSGNVAQLDEWLDAHGGAAVAGAPESVTWSHNFTGLSDDCGASGSATVTFTATDALNRSDSTTAKFTIEDTIGPVIDCPAEITTCGDPPPAMARDDCSGSVAPAATDEDAEVLLPEPTVFDAPVAWTFPDDSADELADAGSAANVHAAVLVFTNTNSGGVPQFAAGATTQAAKTNKWNAGQNAKAWEARFSTLGYANLRVFSRQSSSDSGPRDFALQCNNDPPPGSGAWVDVLEPNGSAAIVVANDGFVSGAVVDRSLPPSMNNRPLVALRWIMTSNARATPTPTSTTVASAGTSSLDDIRVLGQPVASALLRTWRAVDGCNRPAAPREQTVRRLCANLEADIRALTDPIVAGGAASYEVTLVNHGPDPAPDVTLTVRLPELVGYDARTDPAWEIGPEGRPQKALGVVPPNEGLPLTYPLEVKVDRAAAGELCVEVVAKSVALGNSGQDRREHDDCIVLDNLVDPRAELRVGSMNMLFYNRDFPVGSFASPEERRAFYRDGRSASADVHLFQEVVPGGIEDLTLSEQRTLLQSLLGGITPSGYLSAFSDFKGPDAGQFAIDSPDSGDAYGFVYRADLRPLAVVHVEETGWVPDDTFVRPPSAILVPLQTRNLWLANYHAIPPGSGTDEEVEAMRVVYDKLAALAPDSAVIMAGDWNLDVRTSPGGPFAAGYVALLNSGELHLAPEVPTTFKSLNSSSPEEMSDNSYDHFVWDPTRLRVTFDSDPPDVDPLPPSPVLGETDAHWWRFHISDHRGISCTVKEENP